jgi:calcineurin-like phosphoesterase family protein
MDYVISDLHLGHVSLKRLYRDNFASIEEMHDRIVEMWNSKIRNDDVTVYVLGDIGYKEAIEQVMPRLKGRKVLILGNHDKYSREFYSNYFAEVHDTPIFWSRRIVMSHHPIPVEPGVINLHGHTHIIDLNSPGHFNLCVERIDYTPREMEHYEKKLSSIAPPNHKFLEEWYRDIMVPSIARPDMVLKADGSIDAAATKAKKAKERYAKEKEGGSNLGEY